MNFVERELSKSNRNLSEATIKKYSVDLNKLALAITKKPIRNRAFLKKTDDIIAFIDALPNGSKKNYICSILTMLAPNKKVISSSKNKAIPKRGYKKAYTVYTDYLNEYHNKNKKKPSQKNDKEKLNWIDWEIILKFQKELYNNFIEKNVHKNTQYIARSDKLELLNLLCLSLYTLIPPRRLIYAKTLLLSYENYVKYNEEKLDILDNNLFLVILDDDNKFFSFGKDIVKSKTNKNLVINIPKELNDILNIFLVYHKGDFLLFRKGDETQMNKNELSKLLNTLFIKKFNKKISCNMLRKIYATHTCPKLNNLARIADQMNHSVGTHIEHYVKHE